MIAECSLEFKIRFNGEPRPPESDILLLSSECYRECVRLQGIMSNAPVHRVSLKSCAAMCDENFLVRYNENIVALKVAKQYQEGKTGKNIPPDDDPKAINITVQHLYGQSYKDTRPNLEDYAGGSCSMKPRSVCNC